MDPFVAFSLGDIDVCILDVRDLDHELVEFLHLLGSMYNIATHIILSKTISKLINSSCQYIACIQWIHVLGLTCWLVWAGEILEH